MMTATILRWTGTFREHEGNGVCYTFYCAKRGRIREFLGSFMRRWFNMCCSLVFSIGLSHPASCGRCGSSMIGWRGVFQAVCCSVGAYAGSNPRLGRHYQKQVWSKLVIISPAATPVWHSKFPKEPSLMLRCRKGGGQGPRRPCCGVNRRGSVW